MKEKTIFKKVLLVFKICYLFYLLLAFNAFLNGTTIMNYAAYIITVWGIIMLLWMLPNYKVYMKMPNIWVLAVFVISYIISAILNRKYGISGNVKAVIWMVFPIALLYVSTAGMEKAEVKKEMNIISLIYLVYTTVANGVSLSMVYWGRNLEFTDLSGGIHAIGFRWGRLWGIYDDPNHGATISVIAVIVAISLIINVKKIWMKVLLGVSAFINYIYIVFSDSRTGVICMGISVAMALFFMLSLKMKTKRGCTKIFAAILISVIAGSTCIGISAGVKEGYNKLDVVIVKKIAQKKALESKKNGVKTPQNKYKKAVIGRKDDISQDASNGRLNIWKSGFEIVKENPLFGVSYRNMSAYAQENLPDSYIVKNAAGIQYDSMHNLEMDILVSQGVAGIIVFFVLVIQMGAYLIRGRKKLPLENRSLAAEAFTMALVIGVASTFLSIIFYVNTPQGFCFWLALGYLTALMRQKPEKVDREVEV